MILEGYNEQVILDVLADHLNIGGEESATYLELLCNLNCELLRRGLPQVRSSTIVWSSCSKLTKHVVAQRSQSTCIFLWRTKWSAGLLLLGLFNLIEKSKFESKCCNRWHTPRMSEHMLILKVMLINAVGECNRQYFKVTVFSWSSSVVLNQKKRIYSKQRLELERCTTFYLN